MKITRRNPRGDTWDSPTRWETRPLIRGIYVAWYSGLLHEFSVYSRNYALIISQISREMNRFRRVSAARTSPRSFIDGKPCAPAWFGKTERRERTRLQLCLDNALGSCKICAIPELILESQKLKSHVKAERG